MPVCSSYQTSFTPVHTVVPGRVRVRVVGLKGCPRMADRLETELAAAPEVRRAEARPPTGTLLVEYPPELDLADIFRVIATALQLLAGAAPIEEATQRRRQQPNPVPDGWGGSDHDLTTLDAADVVARLDSDSVRGLTTAEAQARLAREGTNALPAPRRRSEFVMLLEQLTTLPVALLGASAAISIATGGLADAAVILGVVAANAAVGFLTESHAERVIASLEGDGPPPARVRREGIAREVPVDQVARGDLLVLEPGVSVAGDARIVSADELQIDESPLTGESMPVGKHAEPLAKAGLPLADRQNIAFRGTTVTGGSGSALVFATGASTEAGRVQTLLGTVGAPQTPLQGQLDAMGRRLVLLCSAVCALIFGVGVLRRMALLPMLRTAISLAVAALPEGLPAVATSTLALGIGRMRRQGVLVRKLPAIETLGAVQTLCFDKTGTLTRNQMSVTAVGLGSGPRYHRGETAVDILAVDEEPLGTGGQALLEVCALCSDATVEGTGAGARIVGSPTEAALLRFALEAGIDVAACRRARPLVGVEHRTEARPLLATHHNGPGDRLRTAVKGSPAVVLERCTMVREGADLVPLDDDRRRRVLAMNQSMATEGLRVLGFAMAERPARSSSSNDLVWLGLLGLSDPIRPGMKELMQVFHRAGIRTVMITGDQSATAYAIARELDLGDGGEIEILDSTRLDQLDPQMLQALAARAHVFARVSPTHKLAIVQAMQRAHRVVAMTGDGVNDSPALRAADVGVAMGRSGTDVARATADIVLADDELATMATAIAQGRAIYGNIRKSIHYLLATNLSEIAVTGLGVTLGADRLVTPMQLLWINLVSDVVPALALALEPPEPDVLDRPPRDPASPILGRDDFLRFAREGAVISAGSLASWAFGRWRYGAASAQPQTLVFSTLTFAQLLHALACRSEHGSLLAPGRLPRNPWMDLAVPTSLGLQASTLAVPPLRRFLGMVPLGLIDLAVVAGASLAPFLVNEALKEVGRRRQGAGRLAGGSSP